MSFDLVTLIYLIKKYRKGLLIAVLSMFFCALFFSVIVHVLSKNLSTLIIKF